MCCLALAVLAQKLTVRQKMRLLESRNAQTSAFLHREKNEFNFSGATIFPFCSKFSELQRRAFYLAGSWRLQRYFLDPTGQKANY